MDSIVEFLKTRSDIKIASLEKELGLPNASIKLSKDYIAPKHEEAIRDYLIKHYGYSEDVVEEIKKEDNVGSITQIVKKYNVGRIPNFTDKKLRFQDDIGLWRRVENYGCDKDGNIKPEWTTASGEVFEDELGGFYIANNGRKIYVTYKG